MSQEQKFFICKHCGNLVGMIHNAGVKIICCGEPMTELVPNTTDAVSYTHLDVYKRQEHLKAQQRAPVAQGDAPDAPGYPVHPLVFPHFVAFFSIRSSMVYPIMSPARIA